MRDRGGKPKIERGTPPTPADPNPSNQFIKHYPDGSCDIHTPPPTRKVLAEYRKAITDYPEDAELRYHFASCLLMTGDKEQAVQQAREALRLQPDWEMPHSMIASILRETEQVEEAVKESREALRLVLQKESHSQHQEALYRWGLAETLLKQGEVVEARQEMERAVSLQQAAVNGQRGSPRLLKQLEAKLEELVGSSQPSP